ncbi:MAG: phage tail tape measure protein [Desulfobacterales bacterium]|nr:phage tail tape measure protein [Desulfobacterales bacterium]
MRIRISTEEARREIASLRNSLSSLTGDSQRASQVIDEFGESLSEGFNANQSTEMLNRLRNSFSMTEQEIARLQARMGDISGALGTLGRSFSSSLSGAMNLKNALLGLGFGMAFKDAFDEFKKFDRALVDMGKVTSESFESIKNRIKDINPILGTSTQLLEGYYAAMSAGVTDSVKAMELMENTAKAAKAAHMEQAGVIEATTKFMRGFGDEVKSSAEALDMLFAIEKVGQTTFEQMIPLLGEMSVLAKNAGISATDMSGAFALLTQSAGSPAEAATLFKAFVDAMTNDSAEMQAVLKATGKTIQELFSDKGLQGGLEEFIRVAGMAVQPPKEIEEALQKMGTTAQHLFAEEGVDKGVEKLKQKVESLGYSWQDLISSTEAYLGISILTANGLKELEASIHAVKEGTGGFQRAWENYSKSAEGVTEQLSNTLTNMKVNLIATYAPDILKGISDFTGLLIENKEAIKSGFDAVVQFTPEVIKLYGAFLAAKAITFVAPTLAAIGTAAFAATPLISGLTAAMNTFVPVALAFAALKIGEALYDSWKQANENIEREASITKSYLDNTKNALLAFKEDLEKTSTEVLRQQLIGLKGSQFMVEEELSQQFDNQKNEYLKGLQSQ